MLDPTILAALLPVAACLLAVALVILCPGPRTGSARQLMREAEGTVTVLLDGDEIEDATPPARRLLIAPAVSAGSGGGEKEALIQTLSRSFPDLRARLDAIDEDGHSQIVSATGPEWIDLEYWDGLVRLTLHGSDDAAPGTAISPLALSAKEEELQTLRALAEDAPQLIWQQDDRGRVIWANRSYLDLESDPASPESVRWPPRRLFPGIAMPEEAGDRDCRRVQLLLPKRDEAPWFDIISIRRGAGSIHFATDATAVVRAEAAQRNFVQTLSKTFADLAIGLAIFDRGRRLAMFNPSLVDLTGLPVDFLASRPPIEAFLDRLREARMLPEPRNYRGWREQIAALETEAADGTYCDLWSLPSGQTYRVTGRPHPDGAIAFLMEDITAEMSLTRRFRGEIDTAHAVFDAMDEGIAVFSSGGTLILANARYRAMWPLPDPQEGDGAGALLPVRDQRLPDEIARWRGACAATDLWPEIRASIRASGDREPWTAQLQRDDGRRLRLRVVPLQGGSTMVAFACPAEDMPLRALRPALAEGAAPVAAHG
ncbi:PAS-domain containing protein [Histidinibacterium lentulum]|uniref:PAS domain-containing protein n=1 Tax=Histidinibacterium lentulum TaxID=2480588 RepID=A0A3N2R726_9RHOB|nr:PAS-domain containing protein [Histidinibacterium lentulum]ROU03183.1 PAS domain-containing protein [Histidinibacterium lentulum]